MNAETLGKIVRGVADLKVLLIGTGDRSLYSGPVSVGLRLLERRALVALSKLSANEPDKTEPQTTAEKDKER